MRALADDEYEGPGLIEGVISKDTVWACTTCMACVEACPCYISQFPKLIDLRRYLVMMESDFPSECQEVFRGMENNSNPWNIGSHSRGDWAKGLNVPLMSEKGAAEYLFYVGDAGSFDDLNKKTAQALVAIFNEVGLDYAILGAEEGCDGDSARKMGNEYLYQTLAQTNIEVFNAYGVKKIICMDPHAYNTIKKDYRELGGVYEVYHYVEILDELIASGALTVANRLDLGAVTLHDSCYLGRYNGLYAEPRRLLSAISSSAPLEMRAHHAKSFCCGAGGGRMWMEEHLGSRINQARTRQALDCGAATVVSACPFCLTMLSDGVKELALDDKLRAVDLACLVAEACGLVSDTKGTCRIDEA
ncbi:MAG: succinate dehydrogenase/fumarate reductase iron-sulfur subunit [Deltaproteobacteria bacterium ADurb.Bin510]|nr:MAG: succinate dehydrogenase/fumarate reductase iron-sulfur subunit [Deltaproteobacteria bacterium ADurb.Bin510]